MVSVAVVAAVASYEYAYELVRGHGDAGWAARLIPLTVDGLIYESSMFSRGPFIVARRGAGVPAESFCNTSHECGARCRRCSENRPARTCNKCNTLRGDGGKLIKGLPVRTATMSDLRRSLPQRTNS